MKVLIIDDDVRCLKLLRDLLRVKNLEVVEAETGNDAVKLASPEQKFCICDIKLPDISGYEVARQIKEKCPQLPIIAHTASVLKTEYDQLMETKLFEAVMQKPLQLPDFEQIVNRFMK